MRCNVTSHQPKSKLLHLHLSHLHLSCLIASILFLIVVSGSISSAQSGRKQDDIGSKPASQTSSAAGNDRKKDQEPPAFLVVTSIPNEAPPYQPPKYDFEYYARGGCVLELKNFKGVKVMEDEDVPRWEARETAITETRLWVIWIELKWGGISASDTALFRMRYLLFEPGTGKLIDSGYGKPFQQTWGKPQPQLWRVNLEEQVQQAGRDVARQVMSELGISQ
ncbi:MAG: hypothetical protein MOB07_14950 [Acidobacteria bacterium]|nr:hypothetical protein [Acidobacteriota bacterium]